jgi:hypothetical protein
MMTGIPVNRIAQTESNKLAVPELIESKVIGQKRSSNQNCSLALSKEIVRD